MNGQSAADLAKSLRQFANDKPEKFVEYLAHISSDASIAKTEWEQISRLSCKMLSIPNIESGLKKIVTPQEPPADSSILNKLFDSDFQPGTFTIAERLGNPAYLAKEDRQDLRTWLHKQVETAVHKLLTTQNLQENAIDEVEKKYRLPIADVVYLILFMKCNHEQRLVDLMYNQVYQDFIHKILALLLWQDPYYFPYIEKDYNQKIAAVAFSILPKISSCNLETQFKYMVASCGVGIDLKSSASAASFLNNANVVWYNKHDRSEFARTERIYKELSEKIKQPFGICFWQEFVEDFVWSDTAVKLSYFHDDVCETIFDLFFIQSLLTANKKITIVSIPRSRRFGNDSCYEDVMLFLQAPIFVELNQYMKERRFIVSSKGPCWGAVNGAEFSEEVVNYVLESKAILVKGSRSHEMLQGIKKDAYFANMTCREFSEAVMGVGADTGVSIFLKQYNHLPTFQGFRERHKRIDNLLGTEKKGMQCLMTARDYELAIRSKNYKNLLQLFSGNSVTAHDFLITMSKQIGVTIDKIILHQCLDENNQTAIKNRDTFRNILLKTPWSEGR